MTLVDTTAAAMGHVSAMTPPPSPFISLLDHQSYWSHDTPPYVACNASLCVHVRNHGAHQIMMFHSQYCDIQRIHVKTSATLLFGCCSYWSAPTIPSCMDTGFSRVLIILLLGKNSSMSTNSNSQIFWASLLGTTGRPGAGRK